MNNTCYNGLVDVAQGLGEPSTLVSFLCSWFILPPVFLTHLSYVFILCTLDACNSCSDDNDGINSLNDESKIWFTDVNKMLDSLMGVKY